MSRIDDLLDNARSYALHFDQPHAPMAPRLGVAVVGCEDARINVHGILGLAQGDAHVISNAGGVVTDDVIRSLTISQWLLGTREVMLIHHANCEMRTFRDEEFKAHIEAETGIRPPWSTEAFTDAAADVRQSISRIKNSPFLRFVNSVRGFVYNERTGALAEVAGMRTAAAVSMPRLPPAGDRCYATSRRPRPFAADAASGPSRVSDGGPVDKADEALT
jgi:carbonic anhydrase